MGEKIKFNTQETNLETKKKIWDTTMAEFLKPDPCGYVLDEKIRDTVVALNLLGIRTTQSDQGNYSNSPWIEFQALEPKDYYEGESELRNTVLQKRKILPESINRLSPLYDRSVEVDVIAESRDVLMQNGAKYTEDFLKYLEDTKKMVDVMQSYIDEYYSINSNLDTEKMKIEIEYGYNSIEYPTYIHQLPSLIVAVKNAPMVRKEEIVKETQAEMIKFTEFLKNKFFQE